MNSSMKALAQALVDKHLLDDSAAEKFVATFFRVLSTGLHTDKMVKIKGLGTFKVTSVAPRESVNVNTGERIIIEGRDKISFTPDAVLRDLVNKPFSQFDTIVVNDGVSFNKIDDMFAKDEEAALEEVLGSANVTSSVTPTVQSPSKVVAQPSTEGTNSAKTAEPETPIADDESGDEIPHQEGIVNQTASEEVEEQKAHEVEQIGEALGTTQQEKPNVPVSFKLSSTQLNMLNDTPSAAKGSELNQLSQAADEEGSTVIEEIPTPPSQDSEESQKEDKSEETEPGNNVSSTPAMDNSNHDVEQEVTNFTSDVKDQTAESALAASVTSQRTKTTADSVAEEHSNGATESESRETPKEEAVPIEKHQSDLQAELSQSNKRIKWLTITVASLALLCLTGMGVLIYMFTQSDTKFNGSSSTEQVAVKATAKPQTTPATKPTQTTKAPANAASAPKDTASQPSKQVASPEKVTSKSQENAVAKAPKAEKTPEEDAYAEYNNKDVRIRTGAYRIVGIAQTVKVRPGQTLKGLSRSYLGPGMDCYMEAVNGGSRELKAGEMIKIPQLKLKKKKH